MDTVEIEIFFKEHKKRIVKFINGELSFFLFYFSFSFCFIFLFFYF